VIVSSGEFDVLGRGTVVVIEANGAHTRTLKSGMRFRYKKNGTAASGPWSTRP